MFRRLQTHLHGKALRINRQLMQFGLHLDQLVQLRHLPGDFRRFHRDKRSYFQRVASSQSGPLFHQLQDFPCYSDHRKRAGDLPKHYFQQDLLVAQNIFRENPIRHIDVGSRIDGFVAHVASFRKIEIIDIRPIGSLNVNISCLQLDITDTKNIPQGICDSLSCLHTIEHTGLGRYGDAINPDGWLLALDNLFLMLEPGGILYLSAPIGKSSIEFNAHRIFHLPDLLEAVSQRARISHISILDDDERLMTEREVSLYEETSLPPIKYGCAIVTARK